jgi:hypothetical protein
MDIEYITQNGFWGLCHSPINRSVLPSDSFLSYIITLIAMYRTALSRVWPRCIISNK